MSQLSSSSIDRGLLLLRMAIGVVFVMHGWQKLTVFGLAGLSGGFAQMGIPFPTVNAAVVIAVELIGGLLVLAGAATRIAAALQAVTMAVATVVAHGAAGFFLPNGYEFTLTLMLVSLALTQTGAGRYSVDGRRAQPTV